MCVWKVSGQALEQCRPPTLVSGRLGSFQILRTKIIHFDLKINQ